MLKLLILQEFGMSAPVALILAGYNKVDSATRIKKNREIMEAYDGEELYMGQNKFLYNLAGHPVIQYVINAVYNAQKSGRRLYDKIYVYNDKESFERVIDVTKYDNLHVEQMTDSVGGHWKDFYYKYIEYGQRVDVFFGDTPRITSKDVEYINREYDKILGKKKDHRNILIRMLFGIVEYDDMTDNLLDNRIKFIKRGGNKGKLKSFVGFDSYQARVGNTGAIIKHKCMDVLMENEAVNYIYNLRKALTPSSISKIMYYLWKSKKFDIIKQIKNKNIKEVELIDAIIEITSKLYKIDLSTFAGGNFHIKKNSARWENDIDGPKDMEAFRAKFADMQM